jgi:1,4-alpha-glucan branching enzyme
MAPEAVEVCLAGDFNAWKAAALPMKHTGNGAWQKTLLLPPGEYAYKFRVDGTWLTDPTNPCICPNCYGTYNSVLTVASV